MPPAMVPQRCGLAFEGALAGPTGPSRPHWAVERRHLLPPLIVQSADTAFGCVRFAQHTRAVPVLTHEMLDAAIAHEFGASCLALAAPASKTITR